MKTTVNFSNLQNGQNVFALAKGKKKAVAVKVADTKLFTLNSNDGTHQAEFRAVLLEGKGNGYNALFFTGETVQPFASTNSKVVKVGHFNLSNYDDEPLMTYLDGWTLEKQADIRYIFSETLDNTPLFSTVSASDGSTVYFPTYQAFTEFRNAKKEERAKKLYGYSIKTGKRLINGYVKNEKNPNFTNIRIAVSRVALAVTNSEATNATVAGKQVYSHNKHAIAADLADCLEIKDTDLLLDHANEIRRIRRELERMRMFDHRHRRISLDRQIRLEAYLVEYANLSMIA